MAESLGVCEALVERIDFVEGTGSFKKRNFFKTSSSRKCKKKHFLICVINFATNILQQ
jgi:hypothetical protein